MSIILRDYQHARKAFIEKTDPSLIPKSQFLFHVYIELNSAIHKDPNEATFSILVKSLELPKYSIETKTLNAYNRPNIVQTKVKYESITIKFHDDSSNVIRNLWEKYYQFYYQDSRLGTDNNGGPMNTYLQKHKYQDNIPLGFGYNPKKDNNGLVNFIQSIRIYSLHAGQHSSYVLVNPSIRSFKHGSHDYAQSDVLEHEMTVDFETVLYSSGGDIKQVTGFTKVGYDNYKSPLETGQENTGIPDDGKLMPRSMSLNGDMDRLINDRQTIVTNDNDNDDVDLGNFFNINQNGIDVVDPKTLAEIPSEQFAGIGATQNNSILGQNLQYDNNPVSQAFYTETTNNGLPLLNPAQIPTSAPKNLLTADRVAINNQVTNQQGFTPTAFDALNINNLNNKISTLSIEKNQASQQIQNGVNVLTALQNQSNAIAGLPQNSNTLQKLQQLNGQIAATQKLINLNQNQVSYYNNELDQAGSDLTKYIG